MQIGMGFMASKSLLTAVNLELFTHLANTELSGAQIKNELGLHERSLYDFLDTLVALGFLNRSGIKEDALYSNAEDSELSGAPRVPGSSVAGSRSRPGLTAIWIPTLAVRLRTRRSLPVQPDAGLDAVSRGLG